jgi:hypothetical protein
MKKRIAMKDHKTGSNLNLHKPQWNVVGALMLVSLLGAIVPALAQQPYETPSAMLRTDSERNLS